MCEEHDLSPTLLYNWQQPFFENGAAAFAKDASAEQRELEKKVEQLQARLTKKDSVIAEVTGESAMSPKKNLGNPDGSLASP